MHDGRAPDQDECAMESPDVEPPEHGSGEAARIAVDDVAAMDLARMEVDAAESQWHIWHKHESTSGVTSDGVDTAPCSKLICT
jgi:hypothetical protein